jgi:hypothetical protein
MLRCTATSVVNGTDSPAFGVAQKVQWFIFTVRKIFFRIMPLAEDFRANVF